MTTSPDALFDVPAPVPPVARLLALAGEYTRHNDSADILGSSAPETGDHARSAELLATETNAAITSVSELRLFDHADLTAALVRLQQIAYLADAASRHELTTSRVLTSFAPDAVVGSAARIAAHMRRRRSGHAPEPDERLDAVEQTALHEIALGHVVSTSSQGRDYVHSAGARVLISTLRSLEESGLAERVPRSAPPAYVGGGPQTRIRLSPAGAIALATVIGGPPAGREAATAPAPAAAATKAVPRSR
ncbi:hypothetical protein OG554_05415 [Streptomyces griseus]|uniref:hypothetical protein n=1 Tax=Streptomyces griseus TaxID=1911 RepID=UPI00386CDC99|nr:hypothetical protein OG554_05415 [Streptomyces fimicarius]